MHVLLLLAACIFGFVLGNPDMEDICDSENERRRECDEKYYANLPQWNEDFLLNYMPPLQDWRDCFGDLKCDRVKKYMEFSEIQINKMMHSHKNLQYCLGNGAYGNFTKKCIKPGNSSCKNGKFYDCIVEKIKKHGPCNTEAVETFKAHIKHFITSLENL